MVSTLLFFWDPPMLNLVMFAVMVGLGFKYELGLSYFVLLASGSLFAVVAGFASFSQGALFSRGRGDVITVMSMLACVTFAVAIGWRNGVWWGVAGAILFWPVMYRLGVKVLIWIPSPGDLGYSGLTTSPWASHTIEVELPEETDEAEDSDEPEDVDEWEGADDPEDQEEREDVDEWEESDEPEEPEDFEDVDEWEETDKSEEIDEQGKTVFRPQATEGRSDSGNYWETKKVRWELPPLPAELRGRRGAAFLRPLILNEEIVLFILDDPAFARELGKLNPFHLVAKSGIVRTSVGMIALILWSVSSRNGHVVDYEHLLSPFDAVTVQLLHSLAKQRFLKVVVRDSFLDTTEASLQFANNFGMKDLAAMCTYVLHTEEPADFRATEQALQAEFTLEDLKNT